MASEGSKSNKGKEMKQVLIYENRKMDPIVWDASTPELEGKALLGLFNLMDSWNFYEDLRDNPQPNLTKSNQYSLYQKAKEGNVIACKQLLSQRKSYEYEFWQLLPVQKESDSSDD